MKYQASFHMFSTGNSDEKEIEKGTEILQDIANKIADGWEICSQTAVPGVNLNDRWVAPHVVIFMRKKK